MDREDLQTSIEDGVLVLRGDKKQDTRSEENGCYRLERSYGSFTRTIPLPDGVDAGKVDAKFYKGVLTLCLPKTASARSAVRKIEIK
jgi:HSP20 family protein